MKLDKTDHSYDDIIHLPHPVSQTRLPMSRMDRAAQFSPFKSLTGLDQVMDETERKTVQKIELDEHEKAVIDEKLRQLQERMSERPAVFVVYFRSDDYKEGGNYCEMAGALRRVDAVERQIVFMDGTTIAMDDLYAIETESKIL